MSEDSEHSQQEKGEQEHHHDCGNLFGCGEVQGTGVVREDIKDAAYTRRTADRILHMDEVNQEQFDGFLTARGRSRRRLLEASTFLGTLAAVGPWFSKLAAATEPPAAADAAGAAGSEQKKKSEPKKIDEGHVHVVESNDQTVRLGIYDTNLPPIVKVDSGDTISYPNTWSHFLNKMQPGVSIDELAKWRVENPGHGPHSIIGPVYVNGAEPGDVLEVRYKKIVPFDWGAVFNNPGSLGTGLLPKEFPEGQVKYMKLDLAKMTTEFAKDIHVPLKPFQGTLGLAPPDGFFPPLSPGVTNSVPPGPHAGNTDLSEMAEGSTMFIPVWKPGALIFTGDSHAVQGDGEISLTACETRMKELRIQVFLHKQKNFGWPIAETSTHWIVLGLDKDLNLAMAAAARNAIEFLAARTSLSKLDAYGLLSMAVSFRVTQVVDIVRGVHAMIPKGLFAPELRSKITVV
ncbi:MAG TPA: acetamidase/formamidase family protein [Candidatus Acidoferrales bacterium]|nr:acetamidase/formamidase family protein [Candidatus Acidoferrales bacterium]